MKHTLFAKLTALTLALCLCALPSLTVADTYLPDGAVTHTDFTLGLKLHADGFPQSKAHLADWETFLDKLDLRGSMDSLALFTPDSRVYLNAALRLNGKSQIPFVYDGYHSYRYLISPALNNEVLHFQMHNFLEFMLKPYYYMELPTQYLALLMYPEASYWIGDSYYTPVAEAIADARADAVEEAQQAEADQQAAQKQTVLENLCASWQAVADLLGTPTAGSDDALNAARQTLLDNIAQLQADLNLGDKAAVTEDIATVRATEAALMQLATDAAPATDEALAAEQQAIASQKDALETAIADAQTATMLDTTQWASDADIKSSAPRYGQDQTLTYTVSYEQMYELCEELDLLANEDPELERVYFYVTCLLAEAYASDMTMEMLGCLEDTLDVLDPEQNGLTVTETPDSTTYTLGDTDVLVKTAVGSVTTLTLELPTSEEYTVHFSYRWDAAPTETGASLAASLSVTLNGENDFTLSADAQGLPREGDLNGQGRVTLKATGDVFTSAIAPIIFDFDWVRDSATLPYTLDLNVDWIHPETMLPAMSLHFNGTLSAVDKSVFVEGSYPQNDFFNLNETFLDEYKERMLPTLATKLAPILLETPGGVINDLYQFMQDHDILVSFVE